MQEGKQGDSDDQDEKRNPEMVVRKDGFQHDDSLRCKRPVLIENEAQYALYLSEARAVKGAENVSHGQKRSKFNLLESRAR